MKDTEAGRELGAALRHLRREKKLQQKELARKARVGPAQLSSYENGRSAPTLPVLLKILAALGADFHALHNSLQIVRGNFEDICRPAGPSGLEAVDRREIVRGLEAFLREVSRVSGER